MRGKAPQCYLGANHRAAQMIETHQLTRTFGGTPAVQDLDLRVEPGEILGFLGPNGAGKSTTVKILTGMIKPTSGVARVAGFDVQQDPMEVKKRLGYVPEDGALYETLTAGEYLTMVANLRRIEGDYAERKITELLGIFDILEARDQLLAEHSKGMKQKVADQRGADQQPRCALPGRAIERPRRQRRSRRQGAAQGTRLAGPDDTVLLAHP